jgi:hypothetical protein
MAAKSRHRRRSLVQIGAEQIAPVLRVELRGEAGRTNKITEHHGDRATFGIVRRRRQGRGSRRLRYWVGGAQTSDRFEQALAIPQIDTQLSQISVGQIRQNVGIDRVVAKRDLVPTKTEAPKPNPDVHRRFLRGPRSMMVLRSHSVYGFDRSSLGFNELRPNLRR